MGEEGRSDRHFQYSGGVGEALSFLSGALQRASMVAQVTAHASKHMFRIAHFMQAFKKQLYSCSRIDFTLRFKRIECV